MQVRRSLILFPCYQLDDFPKNLPARQAAGLLAGWTSLWHPQLIASTDRIAEWCRADQPTTEWLDVLVILPTASESRFPDGLRSQISSNGGMSLNCCATREEMLASLEQLGLISQANIPTATARFVSQFFALGYCYLQIQLMTRQLRYSTNLDVALFTDHAIQAAQATVQGNEELAEQHLQSCFDLLGQERDHYYSHDSSILEILLLAPTTLGAKLTQELQRTTPLNIVASAEILTQLSTVNPEAFELLARRVEAGSLSIIGGTDRESVFPLMDASSLRRGLDRATPIYQETLKGRPYIFSRYRHGATCQLPQLLKQREYKGAVLIAWDAGSYPEASQVKSSWESSDGSVIDTLTGSVLDASSADTFLGFGHRLGKSLDHDHVSTLIVAHWPGQRSEFIEDHASVANRSPALGRWRTLDDYFEKTAQPYHQERFSPSEFRPAYLDEAVARGKQDPISSVVRFHQSAATARQLQNLATLHDQLLKYIQRKNPASANPAAGDPLSASNGQPSGPTFVNTVGIDTLLTKLDHSLDDCGCASHEHQEEVARSLRVESQAQALAVSKLLSPVSTNKDGLVVLNTSSLPRRINLVLDKPLAAEKDAPWLYAQHVSSKPVSDGGGARTRAIVDVPPLGSLWAETTSDSNASKGKLPKSTNLASNDGFLGNEFIEIQIDKKSGMLRSMHVPNKRGNRFSMQLVQHDPRGAGTSERASSTMQCDSMRLVESTPVYGQIEVKGKLCFGDRVAAKYQCDFILWRGSRVLEVVATIEPQTTLLDDPWASYIAFRSAWPNESAILTGTVAGVRQNLPRGKFLSPALIEIDEVEYRTSLLTGGIPYHRRHQERFLDSLLIVKGESRSTFRIGVGMDLPQSAAQAEMFNEQPVVVAPCRGPFAAGATSWFFHVNPAQVLVRLVGNLLDERGNLVGARLEIHETQGKLSGVTIRCLRDVASAYRTSPQGKVLGRLTVDEDSISLNVPANEQALVDVLWK